MLLEVIVPAGLVEGDSFAIDSGDGRCFEISLPKGYFTGDVLPVEAPSVPVEALSLPESPLSRTRSITSVMDFDVVVPEGVHEGESFAVDTDFGPYDVICPAGCSAGSAIVCQLPIESPVLPTGWDARAAQEEAPAAWETPADAWHKYRPGQQVQVLRTDGSYSKATVEYSYEGVFDVHYSVILDGSGLRKPAVAEDEMFDASCADDPNFGLHLSQAMAAAMQEAMLDAVLDQDTCAFFD